MKKRFSVGWMTLFGAGLAVLSLALHFLHYLIFSDLHHICIYLLGDIAFIPLNVLVVTLIIDKLLNKREKQSLMNKLNMVIGVFFSETGNELLRRLTEFSGAADKFRDTMKPGMNWSVRDIRNISKTTRTIDPGIDCARASLKNLKAFLLDRRSSLLRLMENPNLMEHEAFTDVLWAVVHLTEELAARDLDKPMPAPDAAHLAGDIRRAYEQLVQSWLGYMAHLKVAYPYLYSLALRQNPFDPSASATITA